MHCKSSHCECTEHARAECDARLTAAQGCKNKFCKRGDSCPAKVSIDYKNATKGTLDSLLIEMNEHIEGALRYNEPIDFCYDNARRRILRALQELPVTIDPAALAELQSRNALLCQIEATIAHTLTPGGSGKSAGERLLYWLQNTNVLMGRRL